MQSSPEPERVARVFLLIILLSLAGASLPVNHLREVESQPYQDGTYLFIGLLMDLLHNQGSLQTLYKHPSDTSSLLNYFSTPENFNESYWWLLHRPYLLRLFANEETFLLLAHSPWLFKVLHSLIEYSPPKFEKAISNRTFFNNLLQLSSDHPELRTILASSPILMVAVIDEPSLLPLIITILNNSQIRQILLQHPELFPYFLNNPTLQLPQSQEWVLILQPANKTTISRPVNVLVLIRTFYRLYQTVALIQNRTVMKTLNGTIRSLYGSGVDLLNATLSPTNITTGNYYLQVNVTRYYLANLTTQIIIHLTSAAMPVGSLTAQDTANLAGDLEKRS